MRWLRYIVDPPTVPAGVEKKESEPTTGVHFPTEWSNGRMAEAVRSVGVWTFMKPAIGIYGSPKVIGVDRLTAIKGPVVFVANHHSHADTTLLLATIPPHLRRRLAVAAAADYFFSNKVTGTLSTLFLGTIPIERKKLSKLSIRNSEKALASGRSLLIYPEGGRSKDGWNSEHRPGAAFVAQRAGVPVVPVYVDGTGSILVKGKLWPTKSSCAVVFGDPISIGADEDPRAVARHLEQRVSELANEFSVGWWEARKQAHAGKAAEIRGPEVGAWRRRWALGPKNSEKRFSPSKKSWPKL